MLASYLNSQDSDSAQSYTLSPGVYSYLLIGGGGGGTYEYLNSECEQHDVRVNAAGGGSGFIIKGRVVIAEGDVVQMVVGVGGISDTTNASAGLPTSLVVNGVTIATAMGGQGASRETPVMDKRVGYLHRISKGGSGLCGGGSSTGDVPMAGNGIVRIAAGSGGKNGGNGAGAKFENITIVEGGHGYCEGYLDTLQQSIDPTIYHTGEFVNSDSGMSIVSLSNDTLLDTVNVAGGGAGYGHTYHGALYRGEKIDGCGWGAGGGGGHNGVRGYASLIRLTGE